MRTPVFNLNGTAGSFTSATSVNCPMPPSPSLVQGEVALMRVLISSANTTITWPSGWTEIYQGQVGASFTAGLAWKRCDASDAGTSPTISFGTACTGTSRVSTYLYCKETGLPYEGFTFNSGTDSTAESSTITVNGPNRRGIVFYGHDATGTSTTPTGWTNDVTGAVNSTRNYVDSTTAAIAYTLAGGGSEASVTRTHSATAAWGTFSLALVPERKVYLS